MILKICFFYLYFTLVLLEVTYQNKTIIVASHIQGLPMNKHQSYNTYNPESNNKAKIKYTKHNAIKIISPDTKNKNTINPILQAQNQNKSMLTARTTVANTKQQH